MLWRCVHGVGCGVMHVSCHCVLSLGFDRTMNFSAFLRRATSSLKFWSTPDQVPTQPQAEEEAFHLEAALERVEKLQVPEPKEPTRAHTLFKLAPIPVPRAVRLESQLVYLGAWAGTALMAWGAVEVPNDWLLWYGAAAVGVFAVLFRLEGPRTKAERQAREAAVEVARKAHQAAEQRLREVLSERFNERKEEFHTMRRMYSEACQAIESLESKDKSHTLLSRLGSALLTGEQTPEQALTEQIEALEERLRELVDELEDFSDVHKEAIDAAILARHNASLAYWQARLDEAALTGESVQQH